MSDNLANAFRRNARLRMQALGITQKQLAERLHVTEGFVSQMLGGHRNPGLNSLEDFANALKIEAYELIRENNQKNLPKSA